MLPSVKLCALGLPNSSMQAAVKISTAPAQLLFTEKSTSRWVAVAIFSMSETQHWIRSAFSMAAEAPTNSETWTMILRLIPS